VPDGRSVVDFRAFIDQLPLVDTPQIFGLHPNAELTFAATQANDILGAQSRHLRPACTLSSVCFFLLIFQAP
jgi:hypothetical protein